MLLHLMSQMHRLEVTMYCSFVASLASLASDVATD